MKIIIIAILAFIYYWVKQKIGWEKKKGLTENASILEFIKDKSDEIMLSVLAMAIILVMLPELATGVQVWFNIQDGIALSLIQLLIGFLSGIAGTWIVDKFTAFSKRKLNNKFKDKG